VTINNGTNAALEVQDIYTGFASRTGGVTGSVEIFDTLTTSGPNHWWYIYTPGGGTDVYTATGQAAARPATPQSSTSAQNFVYDPQTGIRWEWQKMAFLGRNVTYTPGTPFTPGGWFWTDPTGVGFAAPPADPWYWVDMLPFDTAHQAAAVAAAAAAGTTPLFLLSDGTLVSTDPGKAGRLTFNNPSTMANLTETITGGVGVGTTLITNSDCMWDPSLHCYGPFASSPGNPWYFEYLGSAYLKVTLSVKADNPFHIDFSGRAAFVSGCGRTGDPDDDRQGYQDQHQRTRGADFGFVLIGAVLTHGSCYSQLPCRLGPSSQVFVA
jgi:hypothetical protein